MVFSEDVGAEAALHVIDFELVKVDSLKTKLSEITVLHSIDSYSYPLDLQ